jgi:hypothetical protein
MLNPPIRLWGMLLLAVCFHNSIAIIALTNNDHCHVAARLNEHLLLILRQDVSSNHLTSLAIIIGGNWGFISTS